MANDEQSQKYREVTKILADLDLLFAVSKKPQGERTWTLNPFPPAEDKGEAVSIQLAFGSGWLHIFTSVPLQQEPEAGLLRDLLKLNVMPGAKILLIEPPEAPERALVVAAMIAEGRINLDTLRESLGCVLEGAQHLRSRMKTNLVTSH